MQITGRIIYFSIFSTYIRTKCIIVSCMLLEMLLNSKIF